MSYAVEDKTITTTATIKRFRIERVIVDIFKKATIHLTLLGENDIPIDSKVVELTTEEYDTWGLDDNVLITIICTKLGLTLS